MTLWLQLALLLACILVGARIGGIGLGVVAGFGLACCVFGMPPGRPPTTVLGMITTALGTLAAMDSNPGKARVLLKRALTKTADPATVQRAFDRY